MLFFSEREYLDKYIREYMETNNITPTPFSVISCLVIMGLIDSEKAKLFINADKERKNKK